MVPVESVGRDVHTTINYYNDPGDGTEHAPSIAGKRSTFNQPQIEYPTLIHDITGSESVYTLDSHGFQLYAHRTMMPNFEDDDSIRTTYYPEIKAILRQELPRFTFSTTRFVDPSQKLKIRMTSDVLSSELTSINLAVVQSIKYVATWAKRPNVYYGAATRSSTFGGQFLQFIGIPLQFVTHNQFRNKISSLYG
ncbi:Hypothetical protein D9617_19g101490 [Elsinoe fawcettii]|nr:Hypothetical protein D9617_19g101490 [Elsinoe fawcettii]